jgi:hypothetical protein
VTAQEGLYTQAAQLIASTYEQRQDRHIHVEGLQSVQLAPLRNVVSANAEGDFAGFDGRWQLYMLWFDGVSSSHLIELDETPEQLAQRAFHMLQNRA